MIIIVLNVLPKFIFQHLDMFSIKRDAALAASITVMTHSIGPLLDLRRPLVASVSPALPYVTRDV